MFSKKYTLYIIAFLLLLLCGCAEASAENGNTPTSSENIPSSSQEAASQEGSSETEEFSAYFYGRVLEVNSDFGGILVEPEDAAMASPLVVHSEDTPKLSVGDRIKVEYSGQIALSYPGQIFGARVTPEKE